MANLVGMVMTRGYDPLIVFSFSKRECEQHAASIHMLELNSGERMFACQQHVLLCFVMAEIGVLQRDSRAVHMLELNSGECVCNLLRVCAGFRACFISMF